MEIEHNIDCEGGHGINCYNEVLSNEMYKFSNN